MARILRYELVSFETSPHTQWFFCFVYCAFSILYKLITDEQHDAFDVSVEGEEDGEK